MTGMTGSLHLYHSTPWAARIVEVLGDTPWYVSVYRGDDLRLMLLGFREARRRAQGRGIRRLVRMVRIGLRRSRGFRWYGQPVVVGGDEEEAFRFLGEALGAELRERRLRLVGGEWPLELEGALPSQWQRRRWATLKVDLTADLDTIRSRLKPAARKEIRKADEKGVEVRRIGTLEELEAYAREASACTARYGKGNVSLEDIRGTWKHLRGDGLCFETFAAWHGDHFLAGLSVWGSQQGVGELASYQSEYSFTQKLSGPDLIKWHVILWAKTEGIRFFDLAGVNPAPATDKEANIRRFKEKWGGRPEGYLILG